MSTPTPLAAWAPPRRIARGNAAEQILSDLREQIVSGQFVRGNKLPTEKQLAEGYGVSAATVREAVRGLTTLGLIDVRHGSGAYVTGDAFQLVEGPLRSMIQMERIGVPEVLGVLKALNSYAAETAAAKARPDVRGMRAALQAMEDARDARTLGASLESFLHELARASDNPLLIVLCRFLSGVQVGLAMQLSGGTYEGWRKTVRRLSKERGRLVDAIEEGDPHAARDAANEYHDRAIKVIARQPMAQDIVTTDPALRSLIASWMRA
ncbi:MAG: bacterial regulatory s, gntR family protein [Ramlibacter sp.]|nr:bacterial regulatory s, gntR family protein [Ramlibacter sp.]